MARRIRIQSFLHTLCFHISVHRLDYICSQSNYYRGSYNKHVKKRVRSCAQPVNEWDNVVVANRGEGTMTLCGPQILEPLPDWSGADYLIHFNFSYTTPTSRRTSSWRLK